MTHNHLDDLHNPMYNVRALVKELLLLEEHLSAPQKQCRECILKHALRAEAFTDEALMLNPDDTLRGYLEPLSKTLVGITDNVRGTFNPVTVSRKVRELRRQLQQRLFL